MQIGSPLRGSRRIIKRRNSSTLMVLRIQRAGTSCPSILVLRLVLGNVKEIRELLTN